MMWSRTQDRGLISVAQIVMVATSDMALQQLQMHRELVGMVGVLIQVPSGRHFVDSLARQENLKTEFLNII